MFLQVNSPVGVKARSLKFISVFCSLVDLNIQPFLQALPLVHIVEAVTQMTFDHQPPDDEAFAIRSRDGWTNAVIEVSHVQTH